jgi:rod shape-determining protein MreC
MVTLILASQLPFLAGPRGAVRGLIAPFESASTAAVGGAGAALSVFGDIASLRADNRRLADRNRQLEAQLALLQAAGQENDSLRRALDFQRGFGHRTVAASVIARGPDSFTRSLTIDRGAADGVRAGMVAVTGAGLVGRVREVAGHSASLQTVADPTSRVNAYAVQSNLEGTVSGGPGPLQMSVIPRPDVVAKPGEWVLTSGIGGGYPRGIAVGQVVRFERRDSATSEQAELAWANDLAAVNAVLVITDFLPR